MSIGCASSRTTCGAGAGSITWVCVTSVSRRECFAAPGFTSVSVISLAVGFALTRPATVAVLNAHARALAPLRPRGSALPRHVCAARPLGTAGWRCSTGRLSETSSSSRSPRPARRSISPRAGTQSIRGLRAGPGMIQGLGVLAVTGRMLEPSDFTGDPAVALIGHALWRDRCGSDPSIIGRRIRVEAEGGGQAESFQIVGVLHRSSISAGIVRLGWTC